MSIFYDPYAKKPKVWTYVVFIILPALTFFLIYNYGSAKEKQHPQQQESNALFESAH
jgi:hypothetical protein